MKFVETYRSRHNHPNAGGSVGFHVFEQRRRKCHACCLGSCYDIKYSDLLYTYAHREVMNIFDSSGLSTLFSITFFNTLPRRERRGQSEDKSRKSCVYVKVF